MNNEKKEMFKYKIIGQFNQEHSALRGLMDKNALEVRFERKLYCSEFNLCISVKRLGSHTFQVAFKDLDDLNSKLPAKAIDLSDNLSLGKTKHELEVMEVMDDKIRFSLHKVSLYQEDYQFYYKDEGMIKDSWYDFDYRTGSFVGGAFATPEDFSFYCREQRVPNCHYHKMLPDSSHVEKIIHSSWFNNLTVDAQLIIKETMDDTEINNIYLFFYFFTLCLASQGRKFKIPM